MGSEYAKGRSVAEHMFNLKIPLEQLVVADNSEVMADPAQKASNL